MGWEEGRGRAPGLQQRLARHARTSSSELLPPPPPDVRLARPGERQRITPPTLSLLVLLSTLLRGIELYVIMCRVLFVGARVAACLCLCVRVCVCVP